DISRPRTQNWNLATRGGSLVSFKGCARFVQTSCRISAPGTVPINHEKLQSNVSRDRKVVPDADPPSTKDVGLLYQFFEQSTKLMVLTGAGISTECGIPDYRRFSLLLSGIISTHKLMETKVRGLNGSRAF
ncbi:NAD-dependent protein deacetylase SRT2, partial [Trifolium pratense]